MFLKQPWYDLRFGPLHNLWGEKKLPPSPPWWCFTCELSRTPVGSLLGSSGTVSGVGLDRQVARDRVCGEALERYAGYTFDFPERTPFAVIESDFLQRAARCSLHERAPSTYTRTWLDQNPNIQISHIPGQLLGQERGIWIPETSVSLSPQIGDHEPTVTEISSTGMAFAPSLLEALWRGLCEVIERDNAMISWWCQQPAKRLAQLEKHPGLLRPLHHLSRCGLIPYCFDISQDIALPTVACLLYSHTYPYWSAGSACHPDPIRAIQKAIDEAISVRIMLERNSCLHSDVPVYPQNAMERGLYYGLWPDREPFQYLFESPVCPTEFWLQQDWISSLEDLTTELVDKGCTPMWCNLTTAEIQSEGYVVKVMVPEMVPMTQSEYAWLDTTRLNRHCRVMHSWPHPFA